MHKQRHTLTLYAGPDYGRSLRRVRRWYADDEGDGATTPDGAGNQPAQDAFTQDDVNKIAGRARDEGRQAAINELKEKYGDPEALAQAAKRLQEIEDAEKSEIEKARAEAEQWREKATQQERATQQAQLAALRLEVGQSKGMSPTLAKRLVGATREELEADADAVMAELKPAGEGRSAPDLNATAGGGQQGGGAKLTPEQQVAARKAGMTEEQFQKALDRLNKKE